MGHDYTELMSLALDGRLTPAEKAAWRSHLANCSLCRQRWDALQAIDATLRRGPMVAPAPGFTARFADRLAQRQLAGQERWRTLAGAGVLMVGAVAAWALVGWLLVWQVLAVRQGLMLTPAYLSAALLQLVQGWVLLRALGTAGQALIGLATPWGPLLVLAYAWLSAALAVLWASFAWQFIKPQSPCPAQAGWTNRHRLGDAFQFSGD